MTLEHEPSGTTAAVAPVAAHVPATIVTDDVFAELRRASVKRRQWQLLIYVGWGISALSALSGIAMSLKHHGNMPDLLFCFWFIGMVTVTRKHKRLTRSLAGCDDVRAVPAFLEALSFHDRKLRDLAMEQLETLLPRVQASDAQRFDAAHHRLLSTILRGYVPRSAPGAIAGFEVGVHPRTTTTIRRGLRKRGPERLVLATLAALGQVGVEADLPAIAAVAEYGADPGVRAAAADCGENVQAHAADRQVGATLLRAAQAPAEPGDTLLRAASGGAPDQSQELLRPGLDAA